MKVQWDKVEIVQKMQDYIKENVLQKEFDLNQLYSYIGYSKRHGNRIFKELIGKTPQEYVKLIKISNSTKELVREKKKIIDIALESNFETHEGYTRTFYKTFGTTPKEYRKKPKMIPLFVQYPIKSYYSYFYKKEDFMEKETNLCLITVVEKPVRKLIFLRSKTATDYFSYCEEKGCAWEGLFDSLNEKLDTVAILELPTNLLKEGFSKIAAGIEVPSNFTGEIPEGCEIAQLEAGKMLYFESEPFKKEEDFFKACETVQKAVEKYNPKDYGYEYADQLAPKFQYGGETRVRYARPIK